MTGLSSYSTNSGGVQTDKFVLLCDEALGDAQYPRFDSLSHDSECVASDVDGGSAVIAHERAGVGKGQKRQENRSVVKENVPNGVPNGL